MFSQIRKHVTPVNAILTFALVLTMSGGAFAASKYVITSSKQIKPSVLAQLKGKNGTNGAPGATGPAGPGGPAGPAGKGEKGETGPDGKPGKDGTSGTNGTNGESVTMTAAKKGSGAGECSEGGAAFTIAGKTLAACNGEEGQEGKSVTNAALSKGNANCAEGGTEFKVGTGSPTYACSGKEGSPWTAGGTLPPGKTETGTWAASGIPATNPAFSAFGEYINSSISLPIPTNESLEEAKVHIILFGEGEGEPKQAQAITNGECKGNYAAPAAGITGAGATATGNLCVFVASPPLVKNVGEISISSASFSSAAGKTGAVLFVHPETAKEAIFGLGVWAVTDAQ